MAILADFGVLPSPGGILHPQTKNKWKVTFLGIGTGGLVGPVQSGNGQDILTLQAVQGDRPKLEFEEIELHRYNSRGWIAGKHNWTSSVWQFESDVGGRVSQILQNQLELQQTIIAPTGSPSGVMRTARGGEDYKFAMICAMMDGDVTAIESWAYEGVWIQNIDYGDVDYAANEQVKIAVTFRYDHARQLICGIDKNATGGESGMQAGC